MTTYLLRSLTVAFLLFYFSISSVFPETQGQGKLDKLLQKYESSSKKDTAFLSLLSDISFEYYQIDPEKGIKFGLEGVELSKRIKSKAHQAKILNSLAVNYWSQSRYHEALTCFSEALQINQELRDRNGMSRNLGNMGMVYFNLSDYPAALDYFFRAVKINEETGNKDGMANKYSNIGLVYDKQKIYNKALEYYEKSLELNRSIGKKNGIAINLGNIGNTYASMKDYNKAIEYHLEALNLDLELGNKRGISSDYGNLGEAYNSLGEADQAIQYHRKALEIRKEIDNHRGIMFSYGGLANAYLKKAESEDNNQDILNTCMTYARMAVNIGKQINAIKETADWYQILAQAYRKKSDWKSAYLYTDSFNILQDSVFNLETRHRMSNIQSTREIELKEKEMELLRIRNERRKTIILAVSGGFGLVLTLSLLIYRNLHHKRKISSLLQQRYQMNVTQTDSIQIAHNMLQKEVKKATAYLTSLLPPRIEHGPFLTDYLFIPSKQLGGDSFGYHWIDEHHFAVYIIDVCGHGISSALHSVSVLNLLKSARRLSADPRHPEKVVAALNESFRMEDHGELFFSIWYGVIQKGNHELSASENISPEGLYQLSYTCAGHPNPLLFAPNGDVSELGPSSLAVGCMPGTVFQRQEKMIEKGSKLLLFSDGTYEVSKKDGSVMDILEFKKMVIESYHDGGLSLQTINKLVARHNSMENYEDDFSLLMVQC